MEVDTVTKTSSDTRRKFGCNECGKMFTEYRLLVLHMRIYSGEKPFKCDTCEKRFTQKPYFVAHI